MFIIELVHKEFLAEKEGESRSTTYKVLMTLLKLILGAGFIALLCYTYISLHYKIEEYSRYGAFDFCVLICFLLAIVSVISALIRARKILFDKLDRQLLLPLPLSGGEIVMGKFFYLFVKETILQAITAVPIICCYGALNGFMPYQYVFALLYAPLVCFFIVGLALLLVVPYQQLYKLIKLSDIAQFVVACVAVICLCFLYRYVLNVFLVALNDSSVGGVFTDDFISGLHNAVNFLFPSVGYLNPLLKAYNIIPNLLLFIGISMIVAFAGYFVAAFFFVGLMRKEFNPVKKNKEHAAPKLMHPFKALLKKEFDILFREGTYAFSYTSLLIMEPFLAFVVIASLNDIIYDNLKFYATYFPETINGVNLTLILLFSAVIGASASLSISREEKGVIIMKSLPVEPKMQILAKLIVPTALSFASLLLTEIVLIAGSLITPTVFFVSLILGIILIVFDNYLGIIADMQSLSQKKGKLRTIPAIFSIAWPFVLALWHIGGPLLIWYVTGGELPGWIIYLVEILATALWLLYVFIKPVSKLSTAFKRMEVNG